MWCETPHADKNFLMCQIAFYSGGIKRNMERTNKTPSWQRQTLLSQLIFTPDDSVVTKQWKKEHMTGCWPTSLNGSSDSWSWTASQWSPLTADTSTSSACWISIGVSLLRAKKYRWPGAHHHNVGYQCLSTFMDERRQAAIGSVYKGYSYELMCSECEWMSQMAVIIAQMRWTFFLPGAPSFLWNSPLVQNVATSCQLSYSLSILLGCEPIVLLKTCDCDITISFYHTLHLLWIALLLFTFCIINNSRETNRLTPPRGNAFTRGSRDSSLQHKKKMNLY